MEVAAAATSTADFSRAEAQQTALTVSKPVPAEALLPVEVRQSRLLGGSSDPVRITFTVQSVSVACCKQRASKHCSWHKTPANELILRTQRQPCLVVSPRSTMVAWQLRRRAFSSWRTSASWRQCAARGTGRWCWASAVQRAPRRWLTLRSARCPAACLSCPRLCNLGAAGMHQLHGRPAPCGSGSCGVLSSTWGSRVAVCGALAPVAFGQHAHTSCCLRPLSRASPAARHSLAGIAAPSFLTACLRIVASAPFVHPRGVAFCLAASCALAARE